MRRQTFVVINETEGTRAVDKVDKEVPQSNHGQRGNEREEHRTLRFNRAWYKADNKTAKEVPSPTACP